MGRKKIIVLLSGGMGNQMHQFAFGVFMSNKIKAELFLDVSFYSIDPKRINVTGRDFMLHIFGISKCITSLYSNRWLIRFVKKFKVINYILQKVFRVQYVFDKKALIENNCSTYILVYLFGTLEDYEISNGQIVGMLSVNDNYVEKATNLMNTFRKNNEVVVIVHIRRTDYLLSNSVHHVLDKTYYDSAIGIMRQQLANPIFYFIGDDKEWIKSNFDFSNNNDFITTFNEKDDMIIDFTLLTICNHVITSNSTFSWWGSYLNKNSDKIIISPSKWLKEDVDDIKQRYPSSWIVIE